MAAAAGGDGDDAMGPFVITCKHCRSILADSWSFLFTDEDMECVAMRPVTQTTAAKSMKTLQTGAARGCTVNDISCSHCNTTVGYEFITTSRDLDHFRDVHALQKDKTDFYSLGSREKAVDSAEEVTKVGGSSVQFTTSLHQQLNDIRKIQTMMLSFHERISAMEQKGLGEEEEDEEEEEPDEDAAERSAAESRKRQRLEGRNN